MTEQSLLPINATEQERALELASGKLADLPVEIGKLWNPDDCPESLLPWLAWALSIDEWDSQWSVETRRQQIKNAAFTHRHKGTVGSVKKALASLGVTVDFLEWFEDAHDVVLAPVHNTQPHTFVFVAWANENPYTSQQVFLNQELYDTITRIVNLHKPVRSHYDFLVGAKLDSDLFVAATSNDWTQVSKTYHQVQAVQIPPGQNTLSTALTTGGKNVAVNRHLSQAQPVQLEQQRSEIGAAVTVGKRRFCVGRFYLNP